MENADAARRPAGAVWHRRQDAILAGLFGLGSLALYARTAAPSVSNLFDDNLEFQVAIPMLGIPHPTGYPLFMPLAHLFVRLLPWRDPAGRANLVSAVAGAAAIAVFYLLSRELSRSRPAAAIATLALAISPVWWAQATRADVYTAHGLLLAAFLYLLLRWEAASRDASQLAGRWLGASALVAGLGLAHHRMFVLLLPAALVFVLWTDPALLRSPRRWLLPVGLLLAPLLFYLYLPLRGQAVTSLDGAYRPTLSGTLDWITARPYNVFLTGNPFHYQRDPGFFVTQFRAQMGIPLLLAAIVGLAAAWRRAPRRYVLLLLATIAQVAFAVGYEVEDIGSFLLPAFMLAMLWAALGAALILEWSQRALASRRSLGKTAASAGWPGTVLAGALAVLLLAVPVASAQRAFPRLDLSRDWALRDYGEDMLDSVAPGGEVVGLLGETTLLRYFRDILGRRPDLQVVPADSEPARFAAVDAALQRGQPVYLTRDLPGAAQRYSLDAAGPLIAVSPKAIAAAQLQGREIGAGIALLDAQSALRKTHAGQVLRLALTWSAAAPAMEDLKISARLLDSAGQAVAQTDGVPVHFTYPATAWAPGERVSDVYDLPLPAAGLPEGSTVLLILYRAADGGEIGRLTL